MSNPLGEQPSEAQPNSEADQKPSQAFIKFIRGWPFISGLALACGVGLWRYIESTIWAVYLISAGFCFCLFLAIHKEGVLSSSTRKKNVIAAVIASVILVCGLLFVSSRSSNPTPKLESFKFWITIDGHPKTDLLELTNNTLGEKWSPGGFSALVLPIEIKRSNAALNFVVRNCLPTEAENTEFVVRYSPAFVPNLDKYWKELLPFGEDVLDEPPRPKNIPPAGGRVLLKGLQFTHQGVILSSNGISLPPFSFNVVSNIEVGKIVISAQTKTAPLHWVGFVVILVPTSNNPTPKPFWDSVQVDRTDGNLRMTIPPWAKQPDK